MADSSTESIHKGLAGITVDSTAISKVNPETNSLLYRGYPVQELAERCSFEEVAYLLWHGELPDDAQLQTFVAHERSQRELAANVHEAIEAIPRSAHPMDVVRPAVSIIGANDPDADDAAPQANLAKSVRLFAQLPAVIAYEQRRRRGLEIGRAHV